VSAVTGVRQAARVPLPYVPRAQIVAGRRSGAFGSGPDVSATLVQEFSLHGLGSARSELGASLDHATRSDVERARLEAAGVAALAWIDLHEAQARRRLRDRAKTDAEAIARIARVRFERGVSLPLESSLAASEVGVAELGRREAEGLVVEASAHLNFALGREPGTQVVAEESANDEDDDEMPEPATLPSHVHPSVSAAHARTVLAESDARLARSYARPTIGLGVGWAREGTGEQVVTGSLSVPLPVLDPTRFEGARQESNVALARASEARVRAELARDDALADHERHHSREVRDALRFGVVEPLRESVRLAQASFEAGTADMASLLVVRQRLVVAEERLAQARADVERADVHLAIVRGTLLDEALR
jgi:cobalt-zinc-cadmium efflux system outer membrane protein